MTTKKKKGLGGAFSDESQSIPVTNTPPKVETKTPEKKPQAEKMGKRSDPDYKQIGVYIQKETIRQVKKKLADNDDLDMSKLVDDLLIEWTKKK